MSEPVNVGKLAELIRTDPEVRDAVKQYIDYREKWRITPIPLGDIMGIKINIPIPESSNGLYAAPLGVLQVPSSYELKLEEVLSKKLGGRIDIQSEAEEAALDVILLGSAGGLAAAYAGMSAATVAALTAPGGIMGAANMATDPYAFPFGSAPEYTAFDNDLRAAQTVAMNPRVGFER